MRRSLRLREMSDRRPGPRIETLRGNLRRIVADWPVRKPSEVKARRIAKSEEQKAESRKQSPLEREKTPEPS